MAHVPKTRLVFKGSAILDVMRRLVDVRKLALIAFVASVLGDLLPLLNVGRITTTWRLVPLSVLVLLVTASAAVFYFALFRDPGVVRIPPRLRPIALAGAFVFALDMAVGLPQTWGTLRGGWRAANTLDWSNGGDAIFAMVHDPRLVGFLLLALGEFSNVAGMLVLIALFRQRIEEQTEGARVSRLLNSATRAAVLLLGLWAAFNLVRLLASPYLYFVVRNVALENRLKPPSLARIASEANVAFLASVGQFAAPYVVYMSLPKET